MLLIYVFYVILPVMSGARNIIILILVLLFIIIGVGVAISRVASKNKSTANPPAHGSLQDIFFGESRKITPTVTPTPSPKIEVVQTNTEDTTYTFESTGTIPTPAPIKIVTHVTPIYTQGATANTTTKGGVASPKAPTSIPATGTPPYIWVLSFLALGSGLYLRSKAS